MTLRIAMITVDSSDPRAHAQWWQSALGGEFAHGLNDDYVMLNLDSGPVLAFQKVDDPTPGKNLLHLDLEAEGRDREADRLVALGATVVERRVPEEGFGWVTLADPFGVVFDVAGASETGA